MGLAADGTALALGLGLRWFCLANCSLLSAAVVLVETTNAKLRLFRVPDLLSAAFVLGDAGPVVHVPVSLIHEPPAYN